LDITTYEGDHTPVYMRVRRTPSLRLVREGRRRQHEVPAQGPRQQIHQRLRHTSCQDFVSAQTLHAALLVTGSRVGLSTVYRTLTALAGTGRVDVVRDTNGERLFRYRPDSRHRHHLICRVCGLSLPLDSAPVETWAEHIAHESGFADVRLTVELTGIRTACRDAE
jgi:Fur family ferric uptake transcriptional regulator